MSVAGPIGKVDLSTAEAREKDFQAFRETLDLIDLVRRCEICPPGMDFINVCSCDECAFKIELLRDFEKEIKSKQKLVTDYFVEEQAKEDLCLSLWEAADWTKHMFDLLQKNLKAVSECSKVPKKSAKLGDVCKKMTEMMIEYGFFDKTDVIPQDDDDDASFPYNGLYEIDSGFYYYGKTKAKDEVMALLRALEDLERNHVNDKKIAEAHEKALNPSISRGYIELQIKLVERLPVEELQPKAKELLDEVCPSERHPEMFHKARQFISQTCAAMIRLRSAFWRRFYPSGSTGSNEHSRNGLSETLNLLIAKANSFMIQWEEKYASYYTPHDRSDPKGQPTEK